ncbi:MAG: hypothetical protein QNL33_07260 [Akkermansiaceae bacterium]
MASLSIQPLFAQDKSKDILLVSVGESSTRYSDVAVHLEGLFTNTAALSETQVELLEDSDIESLADGYYGQNPEDVALRDKASEGFGTVILIPTINTTPSGTIEYTEFGAMARRMSTTMPLSITNTLLQKCSMKAALSFPN